jgi:signal transduction histidine kinase
VPIASGSGDLRARAETLPLELDGGERWLSISGVGFEEGTVFAFRDVTEERGIERMKTDFVSTVSHELRTPLAAIYGAAVTLRRDDMPIAPKQRSDLLAVIANEADRLARIVNDILWASRLEANSVPFTIGALDAGEVAARVVQATRLHLPPQVDLELIAPASLSPLAADPDKLSQVLANLLENAVKYSPDGGRVRLLLEQRDGSIRFVVTDEGLGIPAAERERVFEKFYRLDPNLTHGVGGTGLGLYICRELVARMEGRIWVEPPSGRGTTVVVELPAA